MLDIKPILKKFGAIIDHIRGERVVVDITEPRASLESLTAHSVEGYVTTIFCRENRYRCSYTHWWLPSKIIKTYHVFSVIQGKAPDVLVQAYRLERTFPKLLSTWTSNSAQKEAAIEAYLDLLLVEIGRKRR